MDELEALFGDELFDLAQGGEEAALADPGVSPPLMRCITFKFRPPVILVTGGDLL